MIEEQGRTGEQEERDAVAPGMDDMLSLDDDEWSAVLAALPALVSARARNGERTRAFVDAVLWIAATGRPWVRLSSSAGPWHSVYVRFTRWAHEGLWDSEAGDALYFHAKYVHPSWSRTKIARATIDTHIFYR